MFDSLDEQNVRRTRWGIGKRIARLLDRNGGDVGWIATWTGKQTHGYGYMMIRGWVRFAYVFCSKLNVLPPDRFACFLLIPFLVSLKKEIASWSWKLVVLPRTFQGLVGQVSQLFEIAVPQ